MEPRYTLRNVSGKDPPSILGFHEIWVVDFEGREIGKLSGSPISNFHQEPDERGRWHWQAVAYWGDTRPVPAWGNVRLGGPDVATKEIAALEVLEYHLVCRAAKWRPGAWEEATAARAIKAEDK